MRAWPAGETLRQVWVHSFLPVAEGLHRRSQDNVPPAGLRICSPDDTEARYAHKRSTTGVGYKVHLTETGEKDLPSLITQVHTTKAVQNDNEVLPAIHPELCEAALLPGKHLVDAGYVEARQLLESGQQDGVELIGPTQGKGRWQHEQDKGFDISPFVMDWDKQQATCPEGTTSSSWKARADGRGQQRIGVAFAKAECSQCPSLTLCTQSKTQRRTLNLKLPPL
jgi:transposase